MFVARMRDLSRKAIDALESEGHPEADQFRRLLAEARVAEDFDVLLCNIEIALGECERPDLEREVGKLLAEYEAEVDEAPEMGFDGDDDPFA